MSQEMQETWSLFASEGREALEAAESCVLELENGPDQERVNELYRAMHTLKGNARVMGLSSMEALAHHAEDVVGLVRDHGHPMDREVVDMIFQSLDLLGRLLAAAEEAQGDVPNDDAKGVEEKLSSYFGRHQPKIDLTPSQAALPSETPGDLFFFSQLPAAPGRVNISPMNSNLVSMAPPPSSDDTADDPEMVKIFLDVAKEQLDTLQVSVDQLDAGDDPDEARSRGKASLDSLHLATSQMGYDRVFARLEELQALFESSDDFALMREVLGKLFEDVAHAGSSSGGGRDHEAAFMLRAFHAVRMLEQIEIVRAEVSVVERQQGGGSPDAATIAQASTSISVALASLHHAFEHHGLAEASALALQLSDVTGRVGASQHEATPEITGLLARTTALFEDLAHSDQHGAMPDEVAGLTEEADRLLSGEPTCQGDDERRLLAAVPASMQRFFTDDHLTRLRDAMAKDHTVCEVNAMLDEDEALAVRLLEFVESQATVIASAVTPTPKGVVTELLICSPLAESELLTALHGLDPERVVRAEPLAFVPAAPSTSAGPHSIVPGRKALSTGPPPKEATMDFFDVVEPPPAVEAEAATSKPEPIAASEPKPAPATAEAKPAPAAAEAKPAPAASQAKPAPKPSSSGAKKGKPEKEDQLIRLSASKIDALMSLAGEINLALGGVLYHPELDGMELTGFSAAAHRVEMLIRELQDSTAGLGLTPVAGVFNRTRRLVRDLARQTGKDIKLVIQDNETEIDRMLVDRIYEPLIHIIRNAADHGLEPTEDRVAAGKPAEGTIKLVATQEGGSILIRIEDDGRGLNVEKITAIARKRGVIGPDEEVSDERARQLIFEPGFSTADSVSNLSGRGVGMDVVNTTLEDLNGRIQVDSAMGRGTRVDLFLPLTLAFAEVIVVEVAGRLFAIPMSAVSSIFRPDQGQVTDVTAQGETVVRVLDELIPVTWLERFYGEPPANDAQGPRGAAGRIIIAVQTRRGKRAVPIERIVGAERVTMKSLPEPMRGIRAAAGCGVLRSGEVAIALDCERLFDERAA